MNNAVSVEEEFLLNPKNNLIERKLRYEKNEDVFARVFAYESVYKNALYLALPCNAVFSSSDGSIWRNSLGS